MSLSYFLSFSIFFFFSLRNLAQPPFFPRETNDEEEMRSDCFVATEERINLQDDELLTCVVRQTPQDIGVVGGNSYLPPHNRPVARSRNVVAWYVNYFITRKAEIASPWR